MFIKLASNNVSPEECVFLVLSLPAKSTIYNFETITFSELTTFERASKIIVKTECERLEFLLSLCSQIVRFVSP